MARLRLAILDDSQNVAFGAADWSALQAKCEIVRFAGPFADETDAARQLAELDIVVPMRERTPFTASLIGKLPRLKLIAQTGPRTMSLDIPAASARGILVCNTGGGPSTPATAELAFALIMACARDLQRAGETMHSGGWQDGLPLGTILEGKRLGIVGLGRLGARVGRYGKAFGMELVAWSQNLTDETAAAEGALRVSKEELFATSDVISLHLVLSDRSRGIIGKAEIEAMKPGAILINTSRGPLVDTEAMVAALNAGRIKAGIDVFDEEPLPVDHPLRATPNTVLTPHLGYVAEPVMRTFYGDSVENIAAWLDGKPIRMMNPEIWKG
jgi:phosphoglycerate dehydrogenase-like enzyme